MAKLKTREREEIFRIEKIVAGKRDGVAEIHHFRTLASDGNVLERMVLRYSPEEVAKNYGKKQHDYGWKIRGRARAGLSVEELLKSYVERGWTLLAASPSYFDVRGDTVEGISRDPLITTSAAEKRRGSLARRREETETARRKKAEESDGPGYYVTNGYTGSHFRSRVANHPAPFPTYEEAEDFAVKRYQHLNSMSLYYLLPVLVLESLSRRHAEENQGEVLWVDGKSRGPVPDPKQTSLF